MKELKMTNKFDEIVYILITNPTVKEEFLRKVSEEDILSELPFFFLYRFFIDASTDPEKVYHFRDFSTTTYRNSVADVINNAELFSEYLLVDTEAEVIRFRDEVSIEDRLELCNYIDLNTRGGWPKFAD